MPFMIGRDSPILTLNIYVNKYCKFLHCMESDLSSFSNSSKDELII